MITYDDIYSYFYRNIKVDSFDLPSTIQEQKELVEDGIDEYNIRLDEEVTYDNELEEINAQLTKSQIKFISECMKLIILRHMKEDYISTWEVFQNDIGRKNYKDQLSGRIDLVVSQESVLNRLANKLYDNFDGGDE